MEQRSETTGWVGWIFFAGFMMIIAGSLNAIWGLVALLNDQWVVWGNRGSVYLDITQWGWVHIIAGLIVVLAGIGVMSGNILARTIGVIIAGLSLIVNFVVLPVYPVWSLVVIVIDMLVIWALIVHGSEARA